MKYLTFLLIAASIALFSCNQNTPKSQDTTENSGNIAENHTHTYTCPMHPEVSGLEGDKCPKCGMKLEHNDNPVQDDKKYTMKFSSTPSDITAGKETVLSMVPKIVGDDKTEVPLDIEHEKKIHFIMVSNDLSWFDHQHPEYNASGAYELPYTFKTGGKYLLFADYKPSGANHQLEKIEVNVNGKPSPEKVFTKPVMVSKTGAFEIRITSEQSTLQSGSVQRMKGSILKNGKTLDPNSLENYLGAKAHMVVIGVENKNYLHVHPEVVNGNFELQTSFETPGVYRGWIQFQSEGILYTADFVFIVEKGSGDSKETTHQHHH